MKKIKSLKILFISLFVIIFYFTIEPSYSSSFIEQYKGTSHISTKSMIKSFCRTSSDRSISIDDNLDYFDADQSVFMTILCDNVGAGGITSGEGSMLKKSSFYDFGILVEDDKSSRVCDYTSSTMNDCDLSKHLTDIFNQIMNDYFNIAHTKVYILDPSEDDLTKIANNFSLKHLGLEICGDSDSAYKKTCQYLKNYIRKANNLSNKVKILNIDKIKEDGKKVVCDGQITGNMLYCGLYAESNYEINFNDLVYNEYMWYALFMTYYSNILNNPGNKSLSSSKYQSDPDKLNANREKAYQIQKYIYNTKNVIDLSIRTLHEIYNAFPIHIGMTMYQENANSFMKEFAKIYAPIRTLYDKLRNVQEK